MVTVFGDEPDRLQLAIRGHRGRVSKAPIARVQMLPAVAGARSVLEVAP
jgi:hypothetical protein